MVKVLELVLFTLFYIKSNCMCLKEISVKGKDKFNI